MDEFPNYITGYIERLYNDLYGQKYSKIKIKFDEGIMAIDETDIFNTEYHWFAHIIIDGKVAFEVSRGRSAENMNKNLIKYKESARLQLLDIMICAGIMSHKRNSLL